MVLRREAFWLPIRSMKLIQDLFTLMENNIKKEGSDSNITTLCVAISIAIFVLDSFIELGVAGGVPYILVILISL